MKKILYLFILTVCFLGCSTNKTISSYEVIGLKTLAPIKNPDNFFAGAKYEDFSPLNILDGEESYDLFEQRMNSEYENVLENTSNFIEIANYSVNKNEDDLYDFDILTMASKISKSGKYTFLNEKEIEAKTKEIRDEKILTESSKYLVLGSEISKTEFDEMSKHVLKSNKIIFEIIYLVDGNYIYVCLEGK